MAQHNIFKTAITAAALAIGVCAATPAAQAQVRGMLPDIEDVEPLGPLPIDGVWEIREIRERIVIGDGHAYAEDGWLHMLIFQIMPRQVVLSELTEMPDGSYLANDLPLMTKVRLEWVDDDTLRGTTTGVFPVTYHLSRVDTYAPGYGRPDYDAPDYDDGGRTRPPSDLDDPVYREPPADNGEDVRPW